MQGKSIISSPLFLGLLASQTELDVSQQDFLQSVGLLILKKYWGHRMNATLIFSPELDKVKIGGGRPGSTWCASAHI
jgi:hypothetical protein